MMIVMPSAPMATMTVCVKMILKLPPVRNTARTSGLMEKIPMTNARPRNGPSTVKSCRKPKRFMRSSSFHCADRGGDDAVLRPLAHRFSFAQDSAAHHGDGVADAE